MKALLEIQNITLGYGLNEPILLDASAPLKEGRLTALLGVNGIGKSTLIRAMVGMMACRSGKILMDEKELFQLSLADRSQKISLVKTSLPDLGYMTAQDFIGMGRHPYTNWIGRLMKKDQQIIDSVIESMGIENLALRYLFELSDGERQKVIVARALVQDTPVIVMDEPIAFIDPVASLELLDILKKQCADNGKTILFSSHDIGATFMYADDVWLIDNDRTIISGTPNALIENGSVEAVFGKKGFELGQNTVGFKPC